MVYRISAPVSEHETCPMRRENKEFVPTADATMLFSQLKKASLSRYISFSQERIPQAQVKELIKEMRTVGYIDRATLCQWQSWMSEHNRILERGFRMGLLDGRRWAKSMKFTSLDRFMLQMQSKYLAKTLDIFSRFGERVADLIKAESNARMWKVAGPILVERRSWIRLCRQILSLLNLIFTSKYFKLERSAWPDRELLEFSMQRARQVFGRFVHSSTATTFS
jgi:hypothetical protein